MVTTHVLALAGAGFVVAATGVSAQDLSGYRTFALESPLGAVLTTTGARSDDITTLHERPALIQTLSWRVPLSRAAGASVEPVHDIVFEFCDNQLYRLIVTYDRDRTEGLTNDDVVSALAATFGPPILASVSTMPTGRPPSFLADTIVVAAWTSPNASLTLVRTTYAPEFRLVLTSEALSARAAAASTEATRLDAVEAPEREIAAREARRVTAQTASDQARLKNKATFRP